MSKILRRHFNDLSDRRNKVIRFIFISTNIDMITSGVGLVVLRELRPQYASGFEPLARQLGYLIPYSTKWSAPRRGVGPWGGKSLQVNQKKKKKNKHRYDDYY